MKPENKNYENNISRLVKLTGDTEKPNTEFTNSLVNEAINQLKHTDQDQGKEKRKIKK